MPQWPKSSQGPFHSNSSYTGKRPSLPTTKHSAGPPPAGQVEQTATAMRTRARGLLTHPQSWRRAEKCTGPLQPFICGQAWTYPTITELFSLEGQFPVYWYPPVKGSPCQSSAGALPVVNGRRLSVTRQKWVGFRFRQAVLLWANPPASDRRKALSKRIKNKMVTSFIESLACNFPILTIKKKLQ